MTKATRLVAFALGASLAMACAPSRGDAFLLAQAEARRSESAGRFGEAATHYDEASRTAKLPRDKNFSAYLAATMVDRDGRPDEAEKRLRVVATLSPPSEYSPIAAYLAALHRYKAGDIETGKRELEDVAKKFPKTGAAHSAMRKLLLDTDDAGDPKATIALIDRYLPTFRGTELEETLLYERVKRQEASGDREGALTAYLALAAQFPYPKGAYRDDALYRASELEEGSGRPARAIEHLERLLSDRESSSMMGTYERPKFSKAMKRIADLYDHVLHDRVRARESLHRYYTQFRTATGRDSALYREAKLWEQDGQKDTACSRLGTLVTDFPDSRYVPCATTTCANVKRPTSSKSPLECREYLLRESQPEADDAR